MRPLGVSRNQLARAIDVPVGRISDIVNGKRGITPDTALRLAKYFDTSAELWMRLQLEYDLEIARASNWEEIEAKVGVYTTDSEAKSRTVERANLVVIGREETSASFMALRPLPPGSTPTSQPAAIDRVEPRQGAVCDDRPAEAAANGNQDPSPPNPARSPVDQMPQVGAELEEHPSSDLGARSKNDERQSNQGRAQSDDIDETMDIPDFNDLQFRADIAENNG